MSFNYAYRLYTTPEWRELFGPFFRAYRDDYRPVPFSKQLRAAHRRLVRAEASRRGLRRDVRRLADAAQAWRRQYKGWPAMQKLRYVERMARNARRRRADRQDRRGRHHARRHRASRWSSSTSRRRQERQARIDIALDAHLGQIFLRPAAQGIAARRPISSAEHRPELVEKITYWTGVQRPIVRGLIDSDLPHLRADEAVGRGGRGAAISRGGHRAGDHAGDELPDARTVRTS